MKYIYYWIWILVSSIFLFTNKIFSPFGRAFLRFRYRDKEERKQNAEAFNEVFMSFPGGMIDWAAYGLLLLIPFIVFIVLVVSFDIKADWMMSKTGLSLTFIVVAVGLYYYIYYSCVEWLTEKITEWKNR